MRTRSLAVKFILFLSGASALVLLTVISLNYILASRVMMDTIRQNSANLAYRTVNRIEAELAAVKKIPEGIAAFIEEGELDGARMKGFLKTVVERNPEIYGCGIAFEPYAFDSKSLYYAPYFAREKEGIKAYMLGDENYKYFSLDWYQIPRELGRPCWSEPYFDDILMATYSVPFYVRTPEGRKLRGIVQADVSLQWLADIVSSVKVLRNGDAFLISRNGTIITHPMKELIMNETIFSVARQRNDPELREIGRKMIAGESGFVPFVSLARGLKSWMYFVPVPSTGWSLAVVFPEDELLAGVRHNTWIAAMLATGGTLALVLIIIVLTGSITRPLRQMARTAEAIGRGQLDIALPETGSRDEVGKLAEAFRYMNRSLKEYIRKLTETTAAKERIESELKIAHEIQTSILPRIFPAFPDRKEFDIFAMMEPAKEVGGDFYDFFLIDERRLFFVMGDVSGKGVPAALFMMIAKTMLKNEALRGSTAQQIMCKVNNVIALDNPASMFATVFCAILDTQTGELTYSNAGHNPPLVCSKEKGVSFLKVDKGFVLGPMSDFKFTQNTLQLAHGDCFFLYTDGVTEAMNPAKQFFSETRLQQALSGMQGVDITSMVLELRRQIKEFAREEPQSDDITMLVVRFN